MVDLRLAVSRPIGGDRRVAVEAGALLVAVEGAARRDRSSAASDGPQRLQVGVVAHRQEMAGRFRSHAASTSCHRLGLIAQRRSVCLIEAAQLVGETDSSVGRAFITEEPFVDLGAVEHVKCVDDVLEAQPRGVDQLSWVTSPAL